jgi:ankyrin repeat protein
LRLSKGTKLWVRLLLEAKADINSKDEDGRTPLSWAAEKGYEAVVRLLKSFSAS